MDIESFTFDVTNTVEVIYAIESYIKVSTDIRRLPESKVALEIFKIKLFIMKKAASGVNCVVLVPALKNKINNLCGQYLEILEKELELGFIDEGKYITLCNATKTHHQQITALLDVLELDVVIKCEII